MATNRGKTRSAIGKMSRRKGKVFERETASGLRAIYGERVKRGWQAREGHDAPDVENVPFWVECKHHGRVNIQKAVEQARTDKASAKSDLPLLVVAKDTGSAPLAVLEWDVFLEILQRAEKPVAALEAKPLKTKTQIIEVFKVAQP